MQTSNKTRAIFAQRNKSNRFFLAGKAIGKFDSTCQQRVVSGLPVFIGLPFSNGRPVEMLSENCGFALFSVAVCCVRFAKTGFFRRVSFFDCLIVFWRGFSLFLVGYYVFFFKMGKEFSHMWVLIVPSMCLV